MKHIRIPVKSIALAIALTSSLLSCKNDDADPTNDTLAQNDKNFITQAGISNASEVDLGQLAKDKATSQIVKNYANHLITEHTKAQTELITLGASKQYAIPNKPDSVHLNLKAKLSTFSGVKFDSAYIASQIDDHKKSITQFDFASKNAADADVKGYANKYLPHLYQHLTTADSISKNIK